MIIVGLGNPGKKYELTRHNVGFMFVDMIAKAYNLSFVESKKHNALVCEIEINGVKHYLLKPLTYMNNSGDAVRSFMNYYKITSDELLVVYDDLDLMTGLMRIRKSGSAGGHKGMFSIISNLQSGNIHRLRIGISRNPEKPVVEYVLSKFSKKEMDLLLPTFDLAKNIFDDYISKGIDYIMNTYNGVAK